MMGDLTQQMLTIAADVLAAAGDVGPLTVHCHLRESDLRLTTPQVGLGRGASLADQRATTLDAVAAVLDADLVVRHLSGPYYAAWAATITNGVQIIVSGATPAGPDDLVVDRTTSTRGMVALLRDLLPWAAGLDDGVLLVTVHDSVDRLHVHVGVRGSTPVPPLPLPLDLSVFSLPDRRQGRSAC